MNFTNRSSTSELYDLANKIGLKNLVIINKSEFPQYKNSNKNIIINLDSVGNGSHWTAVVPKKKLYFDSYNQLPPAIIPNDYKSITHNMELQTIDAEDCGQLSILFLKYVSIGKKREFFKLFNDVYK